MKKIQEINLWLDTEKIFENKKLRFMNPGYFIRNNNIQQRFV